MDSSDSKPKPWEVAQPPSPQLRRLAAGLPIGSPLRRINLLRSLGLTDEQIDEHERECQKQAMILLARLQIKLVAKDGQLLDEEGR